MLTDAQTGKTPAIYRFVPTQLALIIAWEAVVLRPALVFLARALALHDLETSLRYDMYPSLYRELTTDVLTDALRASTFKYLGYEVGMRHWRKAQTTFCERFGNYHPPQVDVSHYAQRGHLPETARRSYSATDELPVGVAAQTLSSQLAASRCWQDLIGAYLPSRSPLTRLTVP